MLESCHWNLANPRWLSRTARSKGPGCTCKKLTLRKNSWPSSLFACKVCVFKFVVCSYVLISIILSSGKLFIFAGIFCRSVSPALVFIKYFWHSSPTILLRIPESACLKVVSMVFVFCNSVLLVFFLRFTHPTRTSEEESWQARWHATKISARTEERVGSLQCFG